MTRYPLTVTTLACMLALACSTKEADDDTGSLDTNGGGDTGTEDTGTEDTGTEDTDTDTDTPPVELVDVEITGSVLLGTNYGNQIYSVLKATLTSGSAMSRMALFARYCTDAACDNPVALTPLVVDDADDDGLYVYSTASTSGSGFDKAFTITEAPVGTYYMQIVGDTQFSREAGKGSCTDTTNCPGDADVVQIASFDLIGTNISGDTPQANPAPATMEISISGEGEVQAFEDVIPLGSIHFDGDELWMPEAPADAGRLWVASSNTADDARNRVSLIDLEDVSGTMGEPSDDSYTLQKGGDDFAGDICGLVRGDDAMYAIAIDNDGLNVFQMSNHGTQTSTTPVVIVPPEDSANPESWPRNCRGVIANKDGADHLYLHNFKGAGSEATNGPFPLIHVDVVAGSWEAPFGDYDAQAWRGLAIDSSGENLFAVDQSWSKNSTDLEIDLHRIVPISVESDGSLGAIGTVVTTELYADERCGSTLPWVSATAMVEIGGTERLVIGHDAGLAVFDTDSLEQVDGIDLQTFGMLFSQVAVDPSKERLYALPQCKTTAENSDFELPYAAGVENADKNLVAVIDITGSSLEVALTEIDINNDGTMDNGIDMDFWRIKDYIRSFNSTLSIPPVVYTAPQIAVGEQMLFVRGSGIQGNGGSTISASGLGQTQDVGVFDLSTGQGVVLNDYLPWWNGLSAGDGTARWGITLQEETSSVGWIEYLD